MNRAKKLRKNTSATTLISGVRFPYERRGGTAFGRGNGDGSGYGAGIAASGTGYYNEYVTCYATGAATGVGDGKRLGGWCEGEDCNHASGYGRGNGSGYCENPFAYPKYDQEGRPLY